MRSVLYILVSFFLIGVFSQDAKPKNTIEEDVLTFLTKWRNGDTKAFMFPLPSLDKIKLPSVSSNFEGYGAKIAYSTSDLFLSGLNLYSVEQLDIVESTLNASGLLNVSALSVTADKYKISGRALFIPISGSGAMRIDIRKIQLKISIRMRTNSTLMWVDDLQLSFQVGSLVANLEGGPSAVVVLLNASGANIIRSYHDDIVRTVKGLVTTAIDKFLENNKIATPTQLFQLMKDVQATVIQV